MSDNWVVVSLTTDEGVEYDPDEPITLPDNSELNVDAWNTALEQVAPELGSAHGEVSAEYTISASTVTCYATVLVETTAIHAMLMQELSGA